MSAAYAANAVYNFKIVFSDARICYFRAYVMSEKIVTGGISDVVKVMYSLARADIDNVVL